VKPGSQCALPPYNLNFLVRNGECCTLYRYDGGVRTKICPFYEYERTFAGRVLFGDK